MNSYFHVQFKDIINLGTTLASLDSFGVLSHYTWSKEKELIWHRCSHYSMIISKFFLQKIEVNMIREKLKIDYIMHNVDFMFMK